MSGHNVHFFFFKFFIFNDELSYIGKTDFPLVNPIK